MIKGLEKKTVAVLALAVAMVIAMVVVVAIAFAGNEPPTTLRTTAPSIRPLRGPSASPIAPTPSIAPFTVAPTSEDLAELLEVLNSLEVTQEGVFEDPATPQFRAAHWLANNDTYREDNNLDWNHSKIIERYAAATFYFATNGTNWKLCGEFPMYCTITPWLSEADLCNWTNVECNPCPVCDGLVVEMFFCE